MFRVELLERLARERLLLAQRSGRRNGGGSWRGRRRWRRRRWRRAAAGGGGGGAGAGRRNLLCAACSQRSSRPVQDDRQKCSNTVHPSLSSRSAAYRSRNTRGQSTPVSVAQTIQYRAWMTCCAPRRARKIVISGFAASAGSSSPRRPARTERPAPGPHPRLRLRHGRQPRPVRAIRHVLRFRPVRGRTYIGRQSGRRRLVRASGDRRALPERRIRPRDVASTCSIRSSRPDEQAAAAEMFRLTRPGGWVLINVAAMDVLARRPFDTQPRSAPLHTRHARAACVTGAGFTIDRIDLHERGPCFCRWPRSGRCIAGAGSQASQTRKREISVPAGAGQRGDERRAVSRKPVASLVRQPVRQFAAVSGEKA